MYMQLIAAASMLHPSHMSNIHAGHADPPTGKTLAAYQTDQTLMGPPVLIAGVAHPFQRLQSISF